MLDVATAGTPSFLETTLSLARPRLDPARPRRIPFAVHVARRGGAASATSSRTSLSTRPTRASPNSIASPAGVAALGVPALILWGPRDPVFGEVYLRDLLERMPHADVHRFEGAGHLIAEEVDYAPIVLDWLAENVLQPAANTRRTDDAWEWSSEPLWARSNATRAAMRRR